MENEMTAISSDESAGSSHIPVEDMTDTTCPKCGSSEITGRFVETGDGIASQELSCDVCDERWKNVYDFSAVYLIDEGDDGVVIEIPREDAKKAELEAKANTAKAHEVIERIAREKAEEKLEELRTANENLRFELEVAYGQNADLERRIEEMQKS